MIDWGGVKVTEPNSLEHYGILGMKWGVRRTPEQLGHRKEEKLERYKAKETAKVEKRYNKQVEADKKLQAKTKAANKKRKAQGKETPDWIKRDQEVYKQIQKQQKDLYAKELEAIRKMSYKDMQKEKVQLGINYTTALVASTGSIALAALTPVPIGFITVPNAANIKTNMRVNPNNKKPK